MGLKNDAKDLGLILLDSCPAVIVLNDTQERSNDGHAMTNVKACYGALPTEEPPS